MDLIVKPSELFIVLVEWNTMPVILYTNKMLAENVSIKMREEWTRKKRIQFPDIEDEDIGRCLKLSVSISKFDVITLDDWIQYHVKETRK